jgi:hypothetical protein
VPGALFQSSFDLGGLINAVIASMIVIADFNWFTRRGGSYRLTTSGRLVQFEGRFPTVGRQVARAAFARSWAEATPPQPGLVLPRVPPPRSPRYQEL